MLSNMLCLVALAAVSTITANPDAARTPQNTPVTTPVLANDTSSGNPLDPGSVTIATPSAHGTSTVNADGSATFTPAAGFTGTTTYSYRVCDTSRPTPKCATAVVTVTVTSAGGAGGGGKIRVSIKNVYEAELNFGPLGKGWRKGTDVAEGVLERQGREYVGVVTASVESDQQMSGLGSNCGPAHYRDSQQLRVTGHPVDGFNADVQSVTFSGAGRPSNEFLLLEFVPGTRTSQQPQNPDPGQDTVISCHTLIENEDTARSGIMFLPLNDSRWTMKDGGYIIALPSSGTIDYTDNTVPTTGGAQIGPFKAKKSVWTIEVERL
jgi:hypothetical protein